MLAARGETESEFTAFLKRAAEIQLVESTHNGIWLANAKSGAIKLEAGLDLIQKQIALRRVSGRLWPVNVFSVNRRDLAAELLGGK